MNQLPKKLRKKLANRNATNSLLKQKKFDVFGIIFKGDENTSTESIIEKMSGVRIHGRIDEEPYFDKNMLPLWSQDWNEERTKTKMNHDLRLEKDYDSLLIRFTKQDRQGLFY